jgi:hypothetical protein
MQRHPIGPELVPGDILAAARTVLDANWIGASTVPSRSLYPHQWSWDSAFIAIGRSWYDEARARQELMTLFDAQWADGMVPHIVFNPEVPDGAYFPGPDFWDSARSPRAPRGIATSGITQPPVHAAAALAMHRHAADPDASVAFLRALYPKLVAQHRYLATARDAGGMGLPAIVHPWESGFDNSPLWDRLLAGLVIDRERLPAYRRLDLEHAAAEDRPTDAAYDGFVQLAARYRELDYDDGRNLETSDFVYIGPGFCAIYLWSTHALAEIARIVGADPTPHRETADQASRALAATLWSETSRRFDPLDTRSGTLEAEHTAMSFLPLLDPDLPERLVGIVCDDMESSCFHPDLPVHFVVPTYSVESPGFDRRRYWRGPVWLNTNWLLWRGLVQHGRPELADEILRSSLALVAGAGFREYFDPFDGMGHGTADFGWSAALAIDLIRSTGLAPAG